MRHITIFYPISALRSGNESKEKIFGSDYNFNLFPAMLDEVYPVQLSFPSLDQGKGHSAISIDFEPFEKGKFILSPMFKTEQTPIVISLKFLKKLYSNG